MRLKWKTPKGDLLLGLPTALLNPSGTANRTWYSSYNDYITAAENILHVDFTTGTYIMQFPESYINPISWDRAKLFDIIDPSTFDDDWFTSDWECNDARIKWTVTTNSNGKYVVGKLNLAGSGQGDADIYRFYTEYWGSVESEPNLEHWLFYYPEADAFVRLSDPDAPWNDFRTGSTNARAYQLYKYRTADMNSATSLMTDAYLKRNTSGGGGGLVPGGDTPTSDDPYSPGGYSGGGGGPAPTGGTGTTGNGGLHDDTSDAIPTPSLPSDATISSGLFTAYNPDASQLASFANALWNMQVSDINDVLRFLFGGDAFNAVIGLHLLPVAPSTSGSPSIKLGNWDTGVSAPKITSQYKQVPFGSVLLPEYWGNCIDYAPYTKIQLALPYIGIVDVDTDDVLGSTNTLTYNIDVLSGAICATLHCVKFNLSSVIYQWSGACAVSLPFSGASYNSVLSAIAGVAAAGMGFAAMAAGPIGAALPAAALAAGGGVFGAGSAASIMGSMKGKVQKSGSFGANSGALGIMTPYFILTRPVQSVPASWQADKGYPANISAQLGTVTGYTEVSEINLECSGTEAEKKEIIDLLKKGVLF